MIRSIPLRDITTFNISAIFHISGAVQTHITHKDYAVCKNTTNHTTAGMDVKTNMKLINDRILTHDTEKFRKYTIHSAYKRRLKDMIIPGIKARFEITLNHLKNAVSSGSDTSTASFVAFE